MNDESRENLSSLMDGEVSQEAGRFLVRRLGADKGLGLTWARYHMVRDCLRHQDDVMLQQDLSKRVRRALSDEPAVQAKTTSSPRWLKPVAGFAAAASVAFVAVLAVSQGTGPELSSPDTVAAQTTVTESFVSPNVNTKSAVSQPVNLSGRSAQNNQKMNSYLLRHYQATEGAGRKGFVSFVPIVVTQASYADQTSQQKNNKETEALAR
jgi:sigma-E factor negative regulatory protein RseA